MPPLAASRLRATLTSAAIRSWMRLSPEAQATRRANEARLWSGDRPRPHTLEEEIEQAAWRREQGMGSGG